MSCLEVRVTPVIVFMLLSSPAHLFGDGGVLAPPKPVVQVAAQGQQDQATDLHGPYLWTYGIGLEPILDDPHRAQLIELREKKVTLTSIAMACASLGGVTAVASLFATPNFVNVLHPSPAGLTLPIVLASSGLVLGLVAVPLLYLSPGDEKLTQLMADYNKNVDDDAKKGGNVYPLLTDFESFKLTFWNRATEEWKPEWDSTNPDSGGLLPEKIRITLLMNPEHDDVEPLTIDTVITIGKRTPIRY